MYSKERKIIMYTCDKKGNDFDNIHWLRVGLHGFGKRLRAKIHQYPL